VAGVGVAEMVEPRRNYGIWGVDRNAMVRRQRRALAKMCPTRWRKKVRPDGKDGEKEIFGEKRFGSGWRLEEWKEWMKKRDLRSGRGRRKFHVELTGTQLSEILSTAE